MIDKLKDIFLYNPEQPVIFTELYFWGFFAVVLIVMSIVHHRSPLRNACLFFLSLFFYYKTSGFFFSLLLFSTVADWLIGFRIHGTQGVSRKLWLTASILINLGMLVYFKYAYFFADSFNNIFDTEYHPINHFAEATNGLFGTTFTVDKILLPVGISFFTFQTMSYAIDVYQKKLAPVKNILDFGFYVSFFPQLVAGPIVRAADFIPQLYKPYSLTKQQFGIATFWIMNGLAKKFILSDFLATQFVDEVFANPLMYNGFHNLMALYGYSLQVYADFSGYTDIAIGVALLMGFTLPVNFNSPYKADSVGDFWKRWHISLSSWLKDYLYIPLGGNRGGTIGTWLTLSIIVFFVSALAANLWIFVGYIGVAIFVVALAKAIPAFKKWLTTNINVMLTMLIGGLWHGSSWNFVIWGGLNGLGLVVYKLWKKISPWEVKNRWYKRAWAVFLTFNFISFTRIWFRSGSHNTWENLDDKHDIIAEYFTANAMLNQIGSGLKQIFVKFNFEEVMFVVTEYSGVLWMMLIGYIIHWLPSSLKTWYRQTFVNTPAWAQVLVCFIGVFIIYQFFSAEKQPFIYFQF